MVEKALSCDAPSGRRRRYARAVRFRTLLAGGAAIAWMLLAQPALGASVEYLDCCGTLSYFGDYTEVNNVTIVEEPDSVFLITDMNAVIKSTSTKCLALSENSVRCDIRPSSAPLGVFPNDRADSVKFVGGGVWLYGGSGPDTLEAAWGGTGIDSGMQILEGANGADRLLGREGRQHLRGGGGTDLLQGGEGRDVLVGGAKHDVLRGGPGADSLFGGPGDDVVLGGTEDDRLYGLLGVDVIRGGWGNDLLYGGASEASADDLGGGRGDDNLSAGPGNDILRGGPGHDRLVGDLGADLFYARDKRRDVVRGGPGADRAQVDTRDRVFRVEVLF